MKKTNLIIASTFLLGTLVACNSGNDSATTTTGANATKSDTGLNNTNGNPATTTENTTPPPSTTAKTPLDPKDSTFAMKAAVGGMMEVEAGKTAQQNAAAERVKAFGQMMIADHTAANQELASIVTGKGLTPPAALPADKQKHMEEMSKMKGKAFDMHYMDMMLGDHKKTIADFEAEATGGTDADLKAFAAKTLPKLKAHLDSAQAISKARM